MNSHEAAQILGISHDADADTIKKAYRKKSKKAHPDLGGSDKEFARVEEARRVMDAAAKYRSPKSDSRQDPFSSWTYTAPRNPGSSSRASAEDLSSAFRRMADEAKKGIPRKEARRRSARFTITDDHVAIEYNGEEMLIQEPRLVEMIDDFLERAAAKPRGGQWGDVGSSFTGPMSGCPFCTGPMADPLRARVCPVCGREG